VFIVRERREYSKFDIMGRNFEFWDELIGYWHPTIPSIGSFTWMPHNLCSTPEPLLNNPCYVETLVLALSSKMNQNG